MITQEVSSLNQSVLESLPLYITAPLAIIWAPIVEETLYRGCLRKIITNQTIFILVSGLIFGVAHTLSEDSLAHDFALAIPYSTLGFFLAYIYATTDNITNNIFVHAFHNVLGVLMIFLLKG